ncbi:MAG: phosphotransferase [Deltaproteobacteria bacterium]|nr:phosphotransferase [Deltaproteobacteria bacterium]MBI3390758.1 phosphotransferase [Deltaproteobacteria bacterium]
MEDCPHERPPNEGGGDVAIGHRSTLHHGDLVANHAYVENGRLTGIIDWGNAMVTNRRYELGKLYFDTFFATRRCCGCSHRQSCKRRYNSAAGVN